MPGVPLITAGDPEAAAVEEGNVTDAPGDGVHAAEGTTGLTTDEARVDRATRLSDEVERTEAAVETVSLRLPPPEPLLSLKLMLRPRPMRPPPVASTPKRPLGATSRRRLTQRSSRPCC
jgi:hypothetical protein